MSASTEYPASPDGAQIPGAAMPATRLLVTESQAKLYPVLCSALESTHYEIVSCETAADCLRRHKDCHVALVDLFLDDLDGLSLLEELRLARRDMPLIAFACHERLREIEMSAEEVSIQADGSGADAVYIAPFNLGELIATLDRLTALTPAA